jgi:hypothetical protein
MKAILTNNAREIIYDLFVYTNFGLFSYLSKQVGFI